MKALKTGTFYEFAGPLYDQTGKLRVAEGQAAERAASSTR